jgi:hypothetical protein
MFITRHALADAGLEVTLTKQGLSIQGTGPIPEEVREHVTDIGAIMHFDPIDHDRLLEHIIGVGVWKALKGCPTEI